MRIRSLIIISFISTLCFAQTGITFKVEDLSKPKEKLRELSTEQIFRNLILSDVYMNNYQLKEEKIKFPFNIVATRNTKEKLVSFGYHSFFDGMYQAYADHRPFVLSPDMIMLLISQGFARHVNNNSDELRNCFVDFSGKVSLTVVTNNVSLTNPNAPWETIFPEFTSQISRMVDSNLVKNLTCDFSTSTNVTKVASEITIMEAMKPYFEFIVMYVICGIPEVTLEGTPSDWEKVLEKAEYLRKYQLDWWIDEIEPLLREFISASKGKIHESFWMNMFKYHTQKKYGAPNIIDGWIIKFFPYDKDGKRNDLNELKYRDNLPNEIVKVDLNYIETDGNLNKEIPLELWAGFIGLKQDSSTFKLTPQIGWMIRKKDVNNEGLVQKFKSENKEGEDFFGGIQIRVKSFPEELFKLQHIKNLEIEFVDEINIPDSIKKLNIDNFKLTGKISEKGILRIIGLLPKTKFIINGKQYYGR